MTINVMFNMINKKMRYFNYNVFAFVRNFYKRIKDGTICGKYNLVPLTCVGG